MLLTDLDTRAADCTVHAVLQAVAQRHVSAEKAAVIYAMEPVFAALFGWLWLSEMLTQRAAVGALIVVFAVVLSELKPAPKPA